MLGTKVIYNQFLFLRSKEGMCEVTTSIKSRLGVPLGTIIGSSFDAGPIAVTPQIPRAGRPGKQCPLWEGLGWGLFVGVNDDA